MASGCRSAAPAVESTGQRSPTPMPAGPGPRVSPPASRVLLAPAAGVVLAGLGPAVFTSALPAMVTQLHALAYLPWVVAVGLAPAAMAIPAYGALGESLGLRRMFRIAVICFIAGTVACAAAGNLAALLTARWIQGLGSGGLLVLPAAVVAHEFSGRPRARYLGYIVSLHVLASLVGLAVGGVLVDRVSWRAAVLSPVAVGVYAVVAARRIPHRVRAGAAPVSLVSVVLLAVALFGLVAAVLAGSASGPTADAALACLLAAAAALTGYCLHARRTAAAVVPLALLREPTIAITSLVGMVCGLALHGAMTFLPVLYQVGHATSGSLSGLLVMPILGAVMLTSAPIGGWVARSGRWRRLPVTGTAVIAAGCTGLAWAGGLPSPVQAAAWVAVVGVGLGLTLPAMLIAVQASVAPARLGVATATHQLSVVLGAALGVTAMGAVWERRLHQVLSLRLPVDARAIADDALSSATAVAALDPAVARAVRQAVIAATGRTFLSIGLLAVLAHAVAWRLRQEHERSDAV